MLCDGSVSKIARFVKGIVNCHNLILGEHPSPWLISRLDFMLLAPTYVVGSLSLVHCMVYVTGLQELITTADQTAPGLLPLAACL